MPRPWSKLVSNRFQLRLPADASLWLDDERWRLTGGAEFHEPLTPEQIVDPEPGTIWPSFMLPDTLPLISNGYGDWLCLRAGDDDDVSEIVFWTHDGGDWIPYGGGLSEALVFDAAIAVLYPPRPEFDAPPPDEQRFLHAEWARQQLAASGRSLPAFWAARDVTTESLLRQLDDLDVARTASRRNLILDHLDTRLKSLSSAKEAQKVGIPWQPDFVSWLFDGALIPTERREQLSRHFDIRPQDLAQQNWPEAERLALSVLERRRDLGWAWDVAGWAAERRGDLATAIEYYRHGVRPSLFADNTVKFRTHWFANGFGKFSAARLSHLRSHLPADWTTDPYVQLFLENDNATLRERIRDYWLAEAEQAEHERRHADAYHAFYGAGWDMGLNTLDDFPRIFDGLARSARAAGWQARAAIAELHQKFL